MKDRRSRERGHLAGFFVALVLLVVTHLSAETDRAETPGPIPRPDLSSLEPNLRTRFEARHAVVDSLAGAENRRELAEAHGSLGQLYLVYEMYESAQAYLSRARHLDGDNPWWSYYLARALEADGQGEAALTEFAHAHTLDPSYLAAWIRPARLHLTANRPAAAEELFRRALEVDSRCAAAFFGLGKAALSRGDTASAIEHFERVLELQPEATRVRYVLAQAYRKSGDIERARQHLARHGTTEVTFPDPLDKQLRSISTMADFELVLALAGDPEGLKSTRLLTYTLSLLGRVDGAAEQIERALPSWRAGETRARLHYLAGGLWAYRGAEARAIDHFRSALELDRNLEDARVKLANAEARRGRYQEALRLLSVALEKNPDLHGARLKRAASLMALGRDSEAIVELRRLQDIEPPLPEAALRLAVALESHGQLAGAIAAYRSAAEVLVSRDEQATALHRAALLLLRRGELEPGREACEEALRRSPEQAEIRLTLAGVLGHLGRLEDAALQYREALRHDAGLEQAHLGESAILIVLERWPEARRKLDEALRLLPDSDSLAHLLARLLAAAPEVGVRDGQRALELVRALPAYIDPNEKIQRADSLAMAYAAAGHFPEAARALEEAIAAARQNGARGLVEYLLGKQKVYQSGQAWTAASANEVIGGLGPASSP